MSTKEINIRMHDKNKWYGDAAQYWQKIEPTVDGMLQGFESISDVDASGSKKFLKQLKSDDILTTKCHRAADFGAGIGRVTKHFLLTQFDVVDIVEQCENFTNNIHVYLNDESLSTRVEKIFTEGLQTFIPKDKHYDVIWMQWVTGHLTDDDFVKLLKRCKVGLSDGGCIIIKDNIASDTAILDEDDSSVTRTHHMLTSIFKKSGLLLRKTETQQGFPSSLFKVNMYALT